jgi:ABC-type branched-subunit amino acid transport system substrate-binding protein
MNCKSFVLLSMLVVASLMLAACGPQATATSAPAATEPPAQATESPAATEAPVATEPPATAEKTAIVGFTASLTGSLNVESTRQNNGFKLWMDQVNTAGGIKLADATTVKFNSKFYDDESNKDRVQELYTKLVTEDKADFLISPYSSGLADASAVIAEQYGKIMITTGAASEGTYKKGYTLVYQAYTPAGKYLAGAVDLLASLDANAKKIAIIHENDKFSTDVTTALESYATDKGYEVLLNEGYDTGTTDFAPIINKIPADVDAVMGGGHFADGQQFAKALFDKGVNAKFISLLVAPPEPTFAEIGDAAFGIVGPSQWEPLAAFTPDYGPTGADFVSAYKAAYNEDPSYHAAGGYTAGLILQKGIETAGSLDAEAIKAALDGVDMMTFFGHIKFDTSAEQHGLQTGHSMVYIQWQKDASGALVKQVVWPAEGKTAEPVYPLK